MPKTTKQPLQTPLTERHRSVSAGAGTGRQTQAVPPGASLRPNIQKYRRSLAVLYFYTVNFLPFLQIRRLLKKKKDPNTKVFFFLFSVYILVFRSVRKGGNARGVGGKQATKCCLLHTQEPSSTTPCSASCCSSSSSG